MLLLVDRRTNDTLFRLFESFMAIFNNIVSQGKVWLPVNPMPVGFSPLFSFDSYNKYKLILLQILRKPRHAGYFSGHEYKPTSWSTITLLGTWALTCVIVIGTYNSFLLSNLLLYHEYLPFVDHASFVRCVARKECRLLLSREF